ncbi:hypothetical protein SSTU70S_05719 [Stutzerimonas stutzeri]
MLRHDLDPIRRLLTPYRLRSIFNIRCWYTLRRGSKRLSNKGHRGSCTGALECLLPCKFFDHRIHHPIQIRTDGMPGAQLLNQILHQPRPRGIASRRADDKRYSVTKLRMDCRL